MAQRVGKNVFIMIMDVRMLVFPTSCLMIQKICFKRNSRYIVVCGVSNLEPVVQVMQECEYMMLRKAIDKRSSKNIGLCTSVYS